MLGSALVFSVMNALVKTAGRHLPSQEIIFFRALFSLITTLIMIRRAGLQLWGERRGRLVLRGLLGFLALVCFFYAITHLPLAEATVIQFSNPVLTAILAGVFLRERITILVLVSLVVSTIGLVLVARPGFLFGHSDLDLVAALIGLAGAAFSGGAYTVIRSLRDEPALIVVLYMPLVATPLSIPLLLPVAVWPSATQWLVLVGVGAAAQLGQVWMTRGIGLLPAGRATSIAYAQIAFSSVIGVFLFEEALNVYLVAGTCLVVTGTFLSARQSTA
jgi:drug/metabolite transporter (DMT)-like permease